MKAFRAVAAASLMLLTAKVTSAPLESRCQQLAKVTEILASARENGVTLATLAEERIKRQNAALARPKAEALVAMRNESQIRRIEEYVYAVSLPAAEARKVGYKKCLIGDFNE